MPVVMLQGTFSHEPAGTLDLFRLVGNRHPVYIADRIHQVALHEGGFTPSVGALFTPMEIEALLADGMPDVVFTCVPTVNRAMLAVAVGTSDAATAVGGHLAAYLPAAGTVNRSLRARGIRTMGISHGTVNGCQTKHGVPMAGFDHEFTIGALFDAECDGFMLGHIHRAQQWHREGRLVAIRARSGASTTAKSVTRPICNGASRQGRQRQDRWRRRHARRCASTSTGRPHGAAHSRRS